MEFITWIHAKWLYDSNPDALSSWKKETVTFHFSVKDRSRRNCHRILWIWVISLLLLFALSWKSFTNFATRVTPSHPLLSQIAPFRGSEHQGTIYLWLGVKLEAKLEAEKMQEELTRTREVVRGCSFVIRWTKQSKGKVFHYSKLKDSACKHGGQFYISTSSVASPRHFPFFFFFFSTYLWLDWMQQGRSIRFGRDRPL